VNLSAEEREELTRFFGEFFHEIKTPLAIMRTHLEAEVSNESLPFGLRKKLVEDVEEIARINALLGDMKLLLGMENAGRQNRFTSESLLEVVMEVIERLEPIAALKAQKLALICPRNCTLKMERNKIKQLFFNLVDNAIKYSDEGSDIEVLILADPLSVEVKDRGVGVSEPMREKIFAPFVRADATGREGTGLGLAVANAIAQMHGGGIGYEPRQGGGSIFRVRFDNAF